MAGAAFYVTVDQSGGIYNSYSPVARDLWQRKPTLSEGAARGQGRFTAINPRQSGYNYNIMNDYVMKKKNLLNTNCLCTMSLHNVIVALTVLCVLSLFKF